MDIFFTDRVLYLCTCNYKKPLSCVYFCRHCVKLRCIECVTYEVDTHFCPHCLENMPSAEARLKKNRCANCMDCPSCQHTLATRASNTQVPCPDDPDKTIPKKMYYLVCGFCRWTSRDVGLPDQTVASGGWVEAENEYSRKINSLQEYYRNLAQREKQEKERKKLQRRKGYFHFNDKFGVSAAIARKKTCLPLLSSLNVPGDDIVVEMVPDEPSSEIEDLHESYWEEDLNLPGVCTIDQRLAQVESQPMGARDLFPKHKHLFIKKSRRCKECEHNLSKPEYNPSSIKFKIQLAAYYYVPDIKLVNLLPNNFAVGQSVDVVITLTNPGPNICHVNLLPYESDSFSCKLTLPSGEVTLGARDDTAEFDEVSDPSQFATNYTEDPKLVVFRKPNKIGLRLPVTLVSEVGTKGVDGAAEFWAAFEFKWNYVNTFVSGQADENIVYLQAPVFLRLNS